ncbi:unnamed protein product [Fusarium graminearum]|nr:unnamed protein product [Fusarium graminearum]
MASHDHSSDIEMATQPQENHEKVTSTSQTETEQDHETSSMVPDSSRTSKHRRYSWWQSIGPVSATILIVSTLVILASYFVLIALWKGAEYATSHKTPILPNLWRAIVFNDRTAQVITICSAAIRTSISLQIGVLVSALAALILETSGTRMIDIPVLSVGRIQSSPIGMLPVVVRQTTKSLSGAWHSCIIVTSVIILLVSNLNSTILLSDLGNSNIPGPHVTNDTGISFKSSVWIGGQDIMSWAVKPKAQWRFAETRLGKSKYGDTGRVYRAFLPFQDEDTRSSLEYYSGPAIVANTRTICAPLPLYEFSIEYRLEDALNSGPALYLQEKKHLQTFECGIIGTAGVNRTSWSVTLCSNHTKGLYIHPNDEFNNELNNDKTQLLEREKYLMRKIFIMNTTADIWSMMEEDGPTPKRLQNLSSKTEGLWTKIYDSTGVEILTATSCYYNIAKAGIYNVTMAGDAIPREPHWVPNFNYYDGATYTSDRQGFLKNKTGQILSQFGIGVETNDTAQRGILRLDIGPLTDEDNSYPSGPDRSGIDRNLDAVLDEKSVGSNTTWDMSDGNVVVQTWSAHEFYRAVFLTSLLTTGDPALAIQSVLTRLHQVAYYELLDHYDIIYPVTTMHLTDKLIPVQWLGLGLVIGMAVVHLTQVFVVIVIFLSRTRLSALGNAWQAVAQAAHVTKAVESSETDLDKDITAWAEANGHDKDIYVLSPSPQAGKVELRPRQRKG